jgi:hypothetical protein
MKRAVLTIGLCLFLSPLSCSMGPSLKDGTTYTTNAANAGPALTILFERGSQWMHPVKFGVLKVTITPQIAVWIEDTAGNFVENVFVTRCFGKQEWKMAKFPPDSCGRDMCMPYWLNKMRKSGARAPSRNTPLPDAVTGATPPGSFTISTTLSSALRAFVVCAELNKSFDFNDRYTNKSKPNPFNGQPPVVYKARINLDDTTTSSWELSYAGHAGNSGNDAALYENKEHLTTALDMIKRGTISRAR